MKQKNLYFYTNFLAWGLVLFLVANYVFGWTTPTENPPSSNLPAPIDVSSTEQIKTGNLIIEGDLTTGSFTMLEGAEAGKILTTDASGVATWQEAAGGSLWTQTGDDIYYNTGNVGIGTTIPSGLLHVQGPSVGGSGIGTGTVEACCGDTTVTGSGTAFNSELVVGGTITAEAAEEETRTIVSITDDTHLNVSEGIEDWYNVSFTYAEYTMPSFVYVDGNVGIGTTEPIERLEVTGNVKISGAENSIEVASGGIKLNTAVANRPDCSVSTRGTIWVSPAGNEGSDRIYVCISRSAGAYLWSPILMFECGESVTFTYNGSSVTYGTVRNPTTGDCWMDRNLGASQVATAFNDSAAYGDLLQWGRLDDGHQIRTSGTTTNLSSTDDPGHSLFILNTTSPYDWRTPSNDSLWQGDGGINDPCPSGWRIPTKDEWNNEHLSWSTDDYNGGYASVTKLTAGGQRRSWNNGAVISVGVGYYRASTLSASSNHPYYLLLSSGVAYTSAEVRSSAQSIRCIKN